MQVKEWIPPMHDFAPFLPLVGLLLGLLCLGGAFRAGRRRRLVDNLPTSKTTGVFIGLVELKGTAESARPLTSYLAGQPCVYYQWSVEEHWSRTVTETYTDSTARRRRAPGTKAAGPRSASGGEMIPFYLQDDCGVILIRPEGAKLEPLAMFDETCGRGDPLYYGKGPAAGGRRLRPSAAVRRARHPAARDALRDGPGPRAPGRGRAGNRPRPPCADVPHLHPLPGAGQLGHEVGAARLGRCSAWC